MDIIACANNADGNTPLDDDERDALVPSHIASRAELNGWEAENIKAAIVWADSRLPDVLRARTLAMLHKRMFDRTWTWAGKFRTSEKSISPHTWLEVPRLVNDHLQNTRAQHEYAKDSPERLDELAARFHHHLVLIHPWPNGNGRHARLATDVLLRRWGRPSFSWGGAAQRVDGDALRKRYVTSLRNADAGSFDELFVFVRS